MYLLYHLLLKAVLWQNVLAMLKEGSVDWMKDVLIMKWMVLNLDENIVYDEL